VPVSGTERESAVRAAFAEQAKWAERLGSPFTALLCATLGPGLDRESAVGRRVLDWPGPPEATADNVPLRLCGALHFLARSGKAPRLAALYPPSPTPEAEALRAALNEALRTHEAALLPWLDSAPQTNEVGRSAVLTAGLLAVAERFPLPMELLELGASGGLNLNLDLYRYRLGGIEAGDADSPLSLEPEWKGAPPPLARIAVAARAGVDLRPIDLDAGRERLLSYVWPDQPRRLAMLEAALAIASAHPPRVDRGDAADWLKAKLKAPRAPGRARIVLHSVAFQYFPPETQARIAAMIEEAGARASEGAPLAWLRFEKEPADAQYSLRLLLWPGGEDRLLAWAHPHGSRVEWLV
jgi:hypothetical protein